LAPPTRPTEVTPVTEPEENLSPGAPGSSVNAGVSPSPSAGPTTSYEVKKGDSLSKIAKANGVTVKDLEAANNLTRKSILKIGQTLTIPAASAASTTEAPSATTEAVSSSSTLSPPTAPAASGNTYVVKSGDSLSAIAHHHGTTVAALKAANSLTSDRIRVGQKLVLPEGATAGTSATASSAPESSAPAATTESSSEPGVYVVQSGDTLDGIAKKQGVKVSQLMTLNNITNPLKLRIGQKLKLPSGSATPAPVPSVEATTTPPASTTAATTPDTTEMAPANTTSTSTTTTAPAGNTTDEPVPVTPVTN